MEINKEKVVKMTFTFNKNLSRDFVLEYPFDFYLSFEHMKTEDITI
jgi:hypothetical protein